jgi:hypothetical protein
VRGDSSRHAPKYLNHYGSKGFQSLQRQLNNTTSLILRTWYVVLFRKLKKNVKEAKILAHVPLFCQNNIVQAREIEHRARGKRRGGGRGAGGGEARREERGQRKVGVVETMLASNAQHFVHRPHMWGSRRQGSLCLAARGAPRRTVDLSNCI